MGDVDIFYQVDSEDDFGNSLELGGAVDTDQSTTTSTTTILYTDFSARSAPMTKPSELYLVPISSPELHLDSGRESELYTLANNPPELYTERSDTLQSVPFSEMTSVVTHGASTLPKLPRPLALESNTWTDACMQLSDSPADFQPEFPYFNDSDFDYSEGGCQNGHVWLMCKGVNSSLACYPDSEIIDFSHAIPPTAAYPIYGIVFPSLVTLAIIANVFVLMVLSKKHMQSPTNTVLLYMAVADLFVGIVPLPFTFFWFTLRTYLTPKVLTPFWCYVYHYMMDTIPPVCHNVAIWLTVLLAAQRYIYIEYPLKAHYYCTIKDVKVASLIILIVCGICGSMKFGDCIYDTYSGYLSMDDGEGTKGLYYAPGLCLIKWSPFVRWVGVQKYYAIYFWIRAVVFVWLPSALLICLNILLIRSLHRAQRRRDRLFSEGPGMRARERQKESYATSTMLVVIVSVFLVVNLPQGLFVALITADQAFDLSLDLSAYGIAPLVLMIDNMLIIATYPLNFAIYCSMSTLFRDTFKRLFCPNLPPIAGSRRASSFGYGSYIPIAGTVVPVVEGAAAAAASVVFDSSPRSDTALIQESNGRVCVVKDVSIGDTRV